MENERIEAIVRQVIEKMTAGAQPGGRANDAFDRLRDKAVDGVICSENSKAEDKTVGKEACGRAMENADRGASGRERENPRPDSSFGRVGTMSLPGKPVSASGGKTQVTMPLALAVKLIEKMEAKAAEWDMRVVTAVSDASGRPVAIHCMDGAYIGSFDVALNKTYTSIAFQMSTAELGSLSGPGGSLYGIQFTNNGKIVIFGGGEVLKKDGVILGALGVSGGTAEQDTALAAYGKSVFTELEPE